MAFHTGREEYDEERGIRWFITDCGERQDTTHADIEINDGNLNTGEPCQECADAKAKAEDNNE